SCAPSCATAAAARALYPLSLHDALPISPLAHGYPPRAHRVATQAVRLGTVVALADPLGSRGLSAHQMAVRTEALRDLDAAVRRRSEEHTSELQSRFDLVCRLLLDKKNCRVNAKHVVFRKSCPGSKPRPEACSALYQA